jgi:hypothetical protein
MFPKYNFRYTMGDKKNLKEIIDIGTYFNKKPTDI